MRKTMPSILEVQRKLSPVSQAGLVRLGKLSGVSPHTIYKIQLGLTLNPGLETVRSFWDHIPAACAEPDAAA